MGAFTSETLHGQIPDFWFPLSHAEAVLRHERLQLNALCDTSAEAVAKAAKAYHVVATYIDARKLLDDVRPQLLCIATRTVGRADLMLDAAEMGVRAMHVEKPLCNSVSELDRLTTLLSRGDVFTTYGAVRRFMSVYRFAKRLADSGRYGPLREIRVNFGTAALYWTHPHSVDLILFAAGSRRVTGVQCRLSGVVAGSTQTEIENDPTIASATLYFEDGVTGIITQALGADLVLCCKDAEIAVRANGARVEIYSSRDGAIFPSARPFDGPLPVADAEGTFAPISELVGCLDGEASAVAHNAVNRRDILLGQQILFALVQSHLENSRIVAPDAADPNMVIHARTGDRYA
jgi:scyllo-inositol 2-dehydrogenase (NAD+)